MSTLQWAILALAAVIVFWMLGAYNRLIALRNQIGAAFAQLDEGMQRRAAALAPLAEALRMPLPDEHGTLDALLLADAQLRQAAQALRQRPASAGGASGLAAQEAALISALSRVRALVEQHAALQGDPAVAPHLATLKEADVRIGFARQLFNDAAQTYNDAAHQFPTRLLARLYGLGPAGNL